MDRAARVRAELDRVVATAQAAREAGPPCAECRFQSGARCMNIAYAEQQFEPDTGRYEETFTTSTSKARSGDGLCGPEGLLFERRSDLSLWWQGVGQDTKVALTWLGFAIVFAGLAAQFWGG